MHLLFAILLYNMFGDSVALNLVMMVAAPFIAGLFAHYVRLVLGEQVTTVESIAFFARAAFISILAFLHPVLGFLSGGLLTIVYELKFLRMIPGLGVLLGMIESIFNLILTPLVMVTASLVNNFDEIAGGIQAASLGWKAKLKSLIPHK